MRGLTPATEGDDAVLAVFSLADADGAPVSVEGVEFEFDEFGAARRFGSELASGPEAN